jgi:hypothetical protein
VKDSVLSINELSDTNNDGTFDGNLLLTANFGVRLSAPPVIIDSLGSPRIVVGTSDGRILTLRADGTLTGNETVDTSAVQSIIWFEPTPGRPLGTRVVSTTSGLRSGTTFVPMPQRPDPGMLGGITMGAQSLIVAQDPGGGFSLFDLQLVPLGSPVHLDDQPVDQTIGPSVALAAGDLDRDGRPDFILSAGPKVVAFNQTGTLLDGFPVSLSDSVTAGPLIADADGDGSADVLAVTADGVLHAVRRDGSVVGGYPLQVSAPSPTSLALFTSTSGRTSIAVSSGDSGVDGWDLIVGSGVNAGQWSQSFANPRNTRTIVVSTAGAQPLSQQFLPAERVYNWPNPVYGNVTRIRYFTASEANITIRIHTIAGALVTELRAYSAGGVDGEVPWDVSGIDSGIYFARIEATGASRSEVAIIKIAVVK